MKIDIEKTHKIVDSGS